jgi:aristolochene synthase
MGENPSLGWAISWPQLEVFSKKKRKGFLSFGLSRAFSNSFPLAIDDRVGVTCKMLYLSLLIGGRFWGWGLGTGDLLTIKTDQLERMSFAPMLSYGHRIMEVVLEQ